MIILLHIKLNCKKCNGISVKNGFQSNGTQRYYCKSCKLSQQKSYVYKAYGKHISYYIYKLLINSSGISDIGRVLNISNNTVNKRILSISKQIKLPIFNETNQSYEVDELKVSPMNKYWYVTYTINKRTKKVVDFIVGRRTKENLSRVINTLLLLSPKNIYTDRLIVYNSLIPESLHCNRKNQINRIERYHLNLRTHIKRLNRKTICYSKNLLMLEAVMKIYFWGDSLSWS